MLAFPVRRWLSPLRRFLEIESVSGGLLLVCTTIALFLANSPWADVWHHVWETPVVLGFGEHQFTQALHFWVNDGLMTIFFFVVGLEIKREIADGELSDWRTAALPVMAALGGMVVPALVYSAFRLDGDAARGWGIPMATDIAFVVGLLALFVGAPRAGLKIFLLALAIADDVGAVLVIAVVYTRGLSTVALAVGLAGLALIVLLHWIGARRVGIYLSVGTAIWIAFLVAKVHPTVAGVLLGLLTPVRALVPLADLRRVANDGLLRLSDDDADEDFSGRQKAIFGELAWTAHEAVSPLDRLERVLHPLVSFLIMPIFALANAGVKIELGGLTHPVALAVAAGLFIGKPLGIVAASWLAIRAGLARLPAGMDWRVLVGAGCLGGIGFTMSIFVTGLALPPELHAAGKFGTLAGSLASALVGSILLWLFLRTPTGE